jgi:hypothetical protein
MADLSKLSDADLAAIAAGDMSKVSDEALAVLASGGAAHAPAGKQRASFVDETPSDLMRERGGFSSGGSAAKKQAERAGIAAIPRYGGGMLAGTGGPMGALASAGGEGLAQLIEGEFDPGAQAQAAISGYVPLGRAAGFMAKIKNAAKLGLGGAVAEKARATINGDESQALMAGAVGGGSMLAGSALGKIAAMAKGGEVTPQEIERIRQLASDSKPARERIAGFIENGGTAPPADVRALLGTRSGMIEATGQSLAGKEFLQQQASMVNEPVLRGMVREGMGLPKEGRLGANTIKAVTERGALPFKKIAGLSDDASQTIQQLKAVKDEARALQFSLDGSSPPPANATAVREKIAELNIQRDKLEGLVDAYAATTAGTPEGDQIKGLLATMQERTRGADANKARFDARQNADALGNPNPRVQPTDISQFKSDRVNLQTPDTADNPAMRDVLDEADKRLYVQKNRTANSAYRRVNDIMGGLPPSELAQELDAGRKNFARAKTLEGGGVYSEGREILNPQALAALKRTTAGDKLDGKIKEAALIADTLPKATQDIARIGTPNVSRVNGMVTGVEAARALAEGAPIKALSATVPLFGPKLRDHYFSREVQAGLAKALRAGPQAKKTTTSDPRIEAIIARILNEMGER